LGQFTLNKPYNLILATKFNDSSILIAIISCDYLNLSLANEYVGDVTIPTQVIQADQPIRFQYSNQIKLYCANLYCKNTSQQFIVFFFHSQKKLKQTVQKHWP